MMVVVGMVRLRVLALGRRRRRLGGLLILAAPALGVSLMLLRVPRMCLPVGRVLMFLSAWSARG